MCLVLQKRKEKGRIVLKAVKVVEPATINVSGELDNNSFNNSVSNNSSVSNGGSPLQVGYSEQGQEYTLYLVAPHEQDRDDWINALRSGMYQLLLVCFLVSKFQRNSQFELNIFYFYVLKI